MADITPTPLYLKSVIWEMGGNTYEKAISSGALTPTVPTATFKGLSEDAVYTQAGVASWMADISFVQDWENTDSLSAYLFNNQGSEVALSFTTSATSGTFDCTVVIVPGSIGGAVDSFATTSVSLPVIGQPVFTPAV